MIIAAYFVILHVSTFYGAIMHIIADTICLPFYVKNKQFDVVIMLGFLLSAICFAEPQFVKLQEGEAAPFFW